MKKVYFGCSLQHASQKYLDDVHKLREELKKDFEILEFLGLNNGTDVEVFAHDTNGVTTCDLLIAEVSLPSTGLGYEIGLADSLGKQIVAIAHKDAKVSAMVKGNPRIKFIQYDDVQKVVDILRTEYK
jgi:nucleoside 2-deoxyribosyltransferase